MFICIHCSRECKTKQALSNHQKHCHQNPNRIPQPNPTNAPGDFYCPHCGKHCHSINSLKNHIRYCSQNPNRELTYAERTGICNLKNRGWSKGLTKDTDERVKHTSERLKEEYASGRIVSHQTNKPRTVTEKQKISQTMKQNPLAGGLRQGSGRGKKGWYKGYFCDSTYELVYVIYNLDNNILFKRCQRQYEYSYNGILHKYHPDFELSDGSLVEIKGYHTDEVDVKLSSVTDRNIQVLYEEDLKYAFDWVKQHYTYKELSDLYE